MLVHLRKALELKPEFAEAAVNSGAMQPSPLAVLSNAWCAYMAGLCLKTLGRQAGCTRGNGAFAITSA